MTGDGRMSMAMRTFNGALADREPPGESPARTEEARVDVVFDGARRAALLDLGLLDTDSEDEFDRYTRLATELLGVPVSLVSLVDADRQFFKSQSGLPGVFAEARQTPLSHSFCRHVVESAQPFVVDDARVHPLVSDNLALRDIGVVAYAGMPLVLSDGHAIGSFCAIDDKPRTWSERDLRILADLSAAVRSHLELRRTVAELGLRDRLTGLANRALLCAHADHLLQVAGATAPSAVAAISIGLDRFTLVNHAYGVVAADGLLRQVGERLAAEVRGTDMLGRWGGDTFVLLSDSMRDESEALEFAARLRGIVASTPFELDGASVGLSAGIGVAVSSEPESGHDLLARCDGSMRRAKTSTDDAEEAGSGSRDLALRQLALHAALGTALQHGELHVAYQPIVALGSGTPVGFEALARWDSPELGTVRPDEFIPLAERTGAIVKIGEWVLRTACAQLAQWRRSGADLTVSVNLAPLQLTVPDLPRIVAAALSEHALPAASLVLEITEGVFLGAGALASRNLERLRELGVRISLDDFGTGYSGLGYITRFPIDQIKIDRSFVDGLDGDRQRAAVVRAILALARGLELKVVAEGVELEGQREMLDRLGCQLGQGYLFAKPLAAHEISLGPGRREGPATG